MSGEIVNQKGRLNAASEILEMLGCPSNCVPNATARDLFNG